MARYSFKESGCYSCDSHDAPAFGNRYCRYGKRKKRFWSRDPKYKAPKWCPRRKNPSDVRVYRLKDDMSEFMHFTFSSPENKKKPLYVCDHHYKKAHEQTQRVKAKGFFESDRFSKLIDFPLRRGDIIEIDDGLKPYFFYYVDCLSNLRPVHFTPPVEEQSRKKAKHE